MGPKAGASQRLTECGVNPRSRRVFLQRRIFQRSLHSEMRAFRRGSPASWYILAAYLEICRGGGL